MRAELAAAMSEKDLQDAILQAARLGGYLAYHTYDSRRSQAGFVDLVLAHPRGRPLIFAELKTERGRLSLDQADWIDALDAGARFTPEVHVWRPSNLDDVIAMLTGGKR